MYEKKAKLSTRNLYLMLKLFLNYSPDKNSAHYFTHCSKVKMNGKKTEKVPILLPRMARNFPGVKTRSNFFYDWTSSVLEGRWTGTRIFSAMSKVAPFIGGFFHSYPILLL